MLKYIDIYLSVICDCEPWSHTVREENRLKVSERRFAEEGMWAKRNKVTGEWRRLHDK